MRQVLLAAAVAVLLCFSLELVRVAVRPASDGNVAADAVLSSSDTIGMLRWVVAGPIPDEGADWRTLNRVVVLGDATGDIRLDFGRPTVIAAILVQADSDHRYAVDGSLDGSRWRTVWEVPVAGQPGLRSRHLLLPEAATVRRLRIRNEPGPSGSISAIGAIRIHSRVPTGWPQRSPSGAHAAAPAFPWLSTRGIDATKVGIALAGALLLALVCLPEGPLGRGGRETAARRALVVFAIAGFLGWWNFFQVSAEDYARGGRNTWDFYHYYMASKYAPELGYTNLYRCTVAADLEDGFRAFHASRVYARDLATNRTIPTAAIIAESSLCRSRFSPERWSSFASDQAWFRSNLPPIMWRQLPLDLGYNASPVWTALGYLVSNVGRMSDRAFSLLVSIDTVLLVAMWAIAWSTFGTLATCAAVVFWGTNLVAGNGFTAGAFLRQGWLFLAVTGVCALKRRRMALAGFLLAYSALLRVFPVFLLVGVALGAVRSMWARGSAVPTRAHRRFAAGVAVGVAALVGLSFLGGDGLHRWRQFAANTAKYQTTPQHQALGLHAALAFADRPELWGGHDVRRSEFEAVHARPGPRVVGLALAVLFLALLLRALRSQEDWVAAVLGIAWLPFVTVVSNYYWSILLLFGLLIADRRTTGLAFAAVTVPFAALGLVYDVYQIGQSMWGSVVLVLFAVSIAALYAWRSGRGQEPAPRDSRLEAAA